MSEQILWLFAFVAVYLVYGLYWGIASGRGSTSAEDFFLAGRQTPAWVYVLTATAVGLSGWSFIGHPVMVYLDGFQFAQLALGAVVIALAGVLFIKRQWLVGRRSGHITPGQMLSAYYHGEAIRVLTVLIALVFAVPFVGMQLAASGQLIQILTDGLVDRHAAMWILSLVVFLYVCIGGLRAVNAIGALQAMLVIAGIVVIGCIAYVNVGGFAAFIDALARLGASGIGPGSATADGYGAWFSIPGVIQFTAGLGIESPVGGVWTASMILSFGLALMGIQASPAFTMLAFSCRDARGFAPQQVWANGAVVGIVLLFFALAEGMAAHFLGASKAVTDAGLAVANVLPPIGDGAHMELVARYVASIAERAPWMSGLLAVCGLAAIQVAAAAYASTTATMISVDVFRRFMMPAASERALRLGARIALALIFLAALLIASFAPVATAQLGALALGFGAQLLLPLAGLCWLPWVTRQGATLGLFAGLIAVIFTEPIGASITAILGFDLPWGRWPWTIHSAGWGLFFNVVFCAIASLVTRGGDERERRAAHHQWLAQQAGVPAAKRAQRAAGWALTLAWLFFAIGPGAVIGNDLFGAPIGGLAAWNLGIPSLWAWQILWWALGVLVIWWLAYKMELSTAPRAQGEAPAAEPLIEQRPEPRAPVWVRNFLRRVT